MQQLKKYDLEAWFPYQQEYKELVSCSNCTDYQTRNLEVRYGPKTITQDRKKYVHALNCTLTATQRTLACLFENFQTEDGFVVPEPLRPYMPQKWKEFIPYKVELPTNEKPVKVAKKPKETEVKDVGEKVKDLKV